VKLLPKIVVIVGIWLCSMTFGTAQSFVRFANFGGGIDAPFYASDGTNRLSGSNYVAALYVAATNSNAFDLVSPLQAFQAGATAGQWIPTTVFLAAFAPGETIRVQVRFWDRSDAPTGGFDQAEAAGAEIGVAEIPSLTLNLDTTPTPLFGLQSASLIPTLTLSRGGPRIASDAGLTATGSQLPRLCDLPVGTNRWFRLTSSRDVQALVNTDGSSIDTVMAAYKGSIVNLDGLIELACNDDRAPTRTSSAFQLPVEANVLYLICVAGKNNANGPVRLNYATGVSVEVRPSFWNDWLEIRWPAGEGAYDLESSLQGPAGQWEPVGDQPFLVDEHYVLPMPASGHYRSFRLRARGF
jgi:hypothetical protein